MDRHVADVAAPPEDLLAAVAVVVVEVEDRDPLAGRPDDRLGGDRRVVEEAVPAVHRTRRVMAGRPAQPVGGGRAAEHEVRGGQRDVHRRARRDVGAGHQGRRRVEPPEAGPTTGVDGLADEGGHGFVGHPLEHRAVGVGVGRQERPAERPGRRSSDQATSRKRTRPGSWTAVIGASPCSVGPTSEKPPSASSVERIRSARSATSLAGTGMPMNVSTVMSCPRCAGE